MAHPCTHSEMTVIVGFKYYGPILDSIKTESDAASQLILSTNSSTTEFDIFTAMKIQVDVFWIVTPCNDVVGYRRFGRTSCHNTARRHNPEDLDLNLHRREDLTHRVSDY